MLSQHDPQVCAAALDVFPNGRFRAVHGRGDLFVRQLFDARNVMATA